MGNQMAKGTTNKPKHHEEISQHDEVILDEFFSLIADEAGSRFKKGVNNLEFVAGNSATGLGILNEKVSVLR